MLGLSHIALHVALCNSVASLGSNAPVALKMSVIEPDGKAAINQTYHFDRGTENTTTLEFDLRRGIYALLLQVPSHPDCGDAEYLLVLPDHNRQMNVSLGPPQNKISAALVGGSAPSSFTYVKPTMVLFDKSQVKCGASIGTPLNAQVEGDVEFDAYYLAVYSEQAIENPSSVVAALRLKDVHGGYHYVRVPVGFPPTLHGHPPVNEFNIDDDLIDEMATQPEDTLFCPKIYRTEVGG